MTVMANGVHTCIQSEAEAQYQHQGSGVPVCLKQCWVESWAYFLRPRPSLTAEALTVPP